MISHFLCLRGVPFQVRGLKKGGKTWWYREGAIKVIKGDDQDVTLPQPLGDEFEGMTFARFPVTESSWYAEVHVQRMGRTPTMVGWVVTKEEEGKMKIIRMALVDGNVGVCLRMVPAESETKQVEVDLSNCCFFPFHRAVSCLGAVFGFCGQIARCLSMSNAERYTTVRPFPVVTFVRLSS